MKQALIKCPPEVLLRSSHRCSHLSAKYLLPHESTINKTNSKILRNSKVAAEHKFQRRFYKAALCMELKKPLTIGIRESEDLTSREVRIQVSAVGINFGDLLMVKGEYQEKLPIPFTPGSEMSGTVLEVAHDVTKFKPGMRVVGLASRYGAYAEEVVGQVDTLWEVPNQMSFKEAASFVCSYGTAMMGLCRRAHLQKGENVLVTAAAGAVGLAAVDIASNVFEANVIGAAGSDEKCALVKSKGAANTINYRNENVRNKMKEVCPGGANVVFDVVGGSVFKDALRSVAFEGRIIVIGFASGEIPQIPANHLLVKNVTTIGLYWGAYAMIDSDVFRWSVDKCFEEYNAGKIKPHYCATFDLSEINHAFEFVQSRKSTGKVIVEIC